MESRMAKHAARNSGFVSPGSGANLSLRRHALYPRDQELGIWHIVRGLAEREGGPDTISSRGPNWNPKKADFSSFCQPSRLSCLLPSISYAFSGTIKTKRSTIPHHATDTDERRRVCLKLRVWFLRPAPWRGGVNRQPFRNVAAAT
jgi:hypothetical protein